MSKPMRPRRNQPLNILVSVEERETLERLAYADGLGLGAYIRSLIRKAAAEKPSAVAA